MMGQAATVVITVTVILGILAIVAVGLRLYCRVFQRSSFGADDYCMVAAVILSTGIAILTDYTACVTGVGDLSYQPTLDAVVFALKTNFAAENSQIAGMGLVKISLLLYYKRIFISRSFIISSNILIGLLASFTLSVILVVIFSKWPVYEQWNPAAPYNISISGILITFVAGNAMFDLLILSLPITAVRSLQMSTQRKLILWIIFSLGSLCIVASLLRLYYAIQYIRAPVTSNSFFEVPFIYNILMALIELPVFIVAGCLLTLGPLYRSRYGPGSLYRSLRSRLLSNLSRLREKLGEMSSASADPSASTKENDSKHAWRILHEHPIGNDGTHRAQWELSNISTTDDVEPLRGNPAMV